jgi:hypothetical protein
MSGGGNVPTGVMTLKEWVENTDLDEVGKYVKSKLKKPETQIYVIGEEDDYAVTVDTDWKEDKPFTDEEGSEHTLYIGKGVVEIDTDGAFTNTFFTKDANFKITKNYDEMSGGGKTGDGFFGKKKYFFTLSEAKDVWDPELWNTLGKYIMKHLKESNPDNIYFMDNQADLHWMLDVPTKDVIRWRPKGVDNDYMSVLVGKNVVEMNEEGFEAVYFTDKSKASFKWIKDEDEYEKWEDEEYGDEK